MQPDTPITVYGREQIDHLRAGDQNEAISFLIIAPRAVVQTLSMARG